MKKAISAGASLIILAVAVFAVLPPAPASLGEETTADKAVQHKKGPATIPLAIKGLFCPSCEVPVGKALKKLDGVTGVEVSTKNGEAIVEYDPSKVTPEQMIQAVEKSGFKAKFK